MQHRLLFEGCRFLNPRYRLHRYAMIPFSMQA